VAGELVSIALRTLSGAKDLVSAPRSELSAPTRTRLHYTGICLPVRIFCERIRLARVYMSLNVIVSMSNLSGDSPSPQEFLPLGTAVFHILVALAGQDRHGYSIMLDIAARTDGRIKVSPGTLYGAIRRLLEDGLIVETTAAVQAAPLHDDERRRYYCLTKLGHAVASAEAARLSRLLDQARGFGLLPEQT